MDDSSPNELARILIHRTETPLRIEILRDAVDYSNRDSLSQALLGEEFSDREILVDLSHVKYVDGFGFEMFVDLARHRQPPTHFTKLSLPVRTLFLLSHLDFLVK